MGDLKLFDAPFRQQILGQAGIDVVIFDQQYRNHANSPKERLRGRTAGTLTHADSIIAKERRARRKMWDFVSPDVRH
jgi:hypothetical protein